MVVLFGILFLVMAGFSIVFPVLPELTITLGGTSVHMGLLIASYSAMQFLFSPVWGALSDRIGRRPVLLIGLLGFTLSLLLNGLATRLWMLFAARIFGGTLSSAALPTAMAYIADSTDAGDRARGMGLLGAAMGLGVVFGPGIGGVLSRGGLRLPFYVAAAAVAVTLVAAAVFLPESLRRASREAGGAGDAGEHPAAPQAGAGLRGRLELIRAALAGQLAPLYLTSFVVSFAVAGLEGTFGYYATDRLGLQPDQLGWVFLAMGVSVAIVQGGLIGRLVRRFGEVRILQAGLILSAAGFVLITAAWDVASLAVFTAFFGVGNGLIRPGTAALISKRTQLGQGTAIGVMDAFDSLGRIVGPPTAGLLYAFHPSTPYLTGAAVCLGTFAAALGLHRFDATPAD